MTVNVPANSYDAVPYRTSPRATTHPDAAAVQARLRGLQPAPIDRCRVLEIGCGTGGNLHALAAALPGSRFLGIDPSRVQIDLAIADAAVLGLTNVEFRACGIEEFAAAGEPFDYILCHGVFSWVPREIRERILECCRSRLAPHGVAMISYNTYPGWHFRRVARDAMLYATRNISDPAVKTGAAQSYFGFLARNCLHRNEAYGKALADEAERLASTHDYYIFHEHLEGNNQPFYFHEFASLAAAHGLQYLAEAGRNWLMQGLSEEVREKLPQIAADAIDFEQHIDFLRNRAFRHSLLVRADAAVRPDRDIGAFAKMLFRAHCRRTEPTVPTQRDAPVIYANEDLVEMTSTSPLVNAVLSAAIAAAPRALSLQDLANAAYQRLVAAGIAGAEEAIQKFPAAVHDLSESNFLALHTHQAAFVTEVSERPLAWAFARLRVPTTENIPTLLHQGTSLPPYARFLLGLCDGGHSVAEIEAQAETAWAEGRLPPRPEGSTAAEAVREALANFARFALLVG